MRTLPPRRRALPIAATACALAALVSVSAGGVMRAVTERTTRVVTLAADEALAIAVTVGHVTITGDERRRDVRLDITREAPTAEALARAPIDLVSRVGEPSRLQLTQIDGGTDAAIRTDVVVSAPATVRLDAITIADGRLTLRHLRGEVRASVARGAISADDVAGVMRLETTIGNVDVTHATVAAGGLLRLRAFNGDVRLSLSAPLVNARVLALALNGTIAGTQPLTRKEGWGPRWAETTIGQPDRVVSVDVVTGTIRIDAPAAR